MKLAFDLDGTLYDSFPAIFNMDQEIRIRMGYSPIDSEVYRRKFQANNWNKFYRELGIREEDLETYMSLFVQEFSKIPPPPIIPSATRALTRSIRALGPDNVHIITNEPKERVKVRFKRDGLSHLLRNVRNPPEGKAKELYALSTDTEILAYVGDLVSDGESCKEAVRMGAANILFYGITHQEAMNPRDIMLEFIEKNKSFARELNNLEEISKTWNQE